MDDETIVDACCLINLCAMGNVRELVLALGGDWYVPTAVLAETMYLRVELDEGTIEKQQVDVEQLVDQGILALCAAKAGQELALYVDLATRLDDGEAMALAIAKSRGWMLSTDDRKAKRIAGEMGVRIMTTPEILKRWADSARPTPEQIREAINRIEQRARFIPSPRDPLHHWWTNSRVEDVD